MSTSRTVSGTATWLVHIYLLEDRDGGTAARAVLETGTTQLEASAHARATEDRAVPEIGWELAAARALDGLARELLGTSQKDVDALAVRESHGSAEI